MKKWNTPFSSIFLSPTYVDTECKCVSVCTLRMHFAGFAMHTSGKCNNIPQLQLSVEDPTEV